MSEPLLQQILVELKDMKSEFSTMKSEISTMKSEIGTMKSEISTIKNDMATKKDVELLASIKQAVSEVNKEVVATSERVQNIEVTLRSHDSILDLLWRRSLDQEAALRRIK